MHARDVMSPDPVTCDESAPCAEVARLMRDRGVGLVCVLRRGRLAGVVTDRHLVTACVAEDLDPATTEVGHVMMHPAAVDEEDSVFAVLDTLRSSGMVRRVPVLGAGGQLVGVVSLSDLAVVAKELVDAILAEDVHNATRNARALTGAKRVAKRIRRPGKAPGRGARAAPARRGRRAARAASAEEAPAFS